MSLTALLKSIRSGRPGVTGRRIGTIRGYLTRLAAAVGEARLGRGAVGTADFDAAIKAAGNRLTWFDAETASPLARFPKGATGWTEPPAGSKHAIKYQAADKPASGYEMASGSILDFDAVITTARRDRDGDVLTPRGAVIDDRMPLLWQHVPYQPVGKFVKLLEQSDERVAGRFMVANTLLGQDAAVLVDAGCLRISHGFAPIEYNPLKDDSGKELGGWRIGKYAMMECSLVSIPSNVDAEITQWSRGKLHHPLIKGWCAALRRAVPRSVRSGFVAGGAGGINLTINLKGLVAAPGVSAVAAPRPIKAPPHLPPDDEDDEDSELEERAGEMPDEVPDDKGEDEEPTEPESKSVRVLGELIDATRSLCKDKTLPKEAARRMGVVDGLLEDIEEGIGSHADAIGLHAKNRDLAGMYGRMAELTDHCVGRLKSAVEELGRIGGIKGVSENSVKQIDGIASEANGIVDAVKAMTTSAYQAGVDETGGDPDADVEPGDGDPADELVDMDHQDGEGGGEGEDDEDEFDSELEEREEYGNAAADPDAEEELDDEDREEEDDEKTGANQYEAWCQDCGNLFDVDKDKFRNAKCPKCGSRNVNPRDADVEEKDEAVGEDDELLPDEENPEVDGEPNPGIPRRSSGAGSASDVRRDRLLGLHMAGESMTPAQQRELRRLMGTNGAAGPPGG